MELSPIDKVKSALRRLDLSDNEQTIYLSLLTKGQATARTLTSRTSLTRPSVYDQIKSLKKLGLVNELSIENKAHFAASDLKHLSALLEDRIDHLEQSRDFLEDALPHLRDSLETADPKVRFFYGQDGVKQLMKDIMWYDNETMQVLWPHESMTGVFDSKFLAWFDDRRAKRKLAIHSLWPKDIPQTERVLFDILPEDTQKTLTSDPPSMSYLIYGTKVAYISSKAESFGYIVDSKEHHDLLASQFDILWKSTK